MPNYEYICRNCGNIKNEIKSVSKRDDVLVCEKCESIMHRTISPSAIKVNGFNAKNGYSHTNQSIKGE
jgi:putative FmdB family regulatory protein